MKKQVLIVGGGMTFKSQKDHIKWLKSLKISLDKQPNLSNKYIEEKLKNYQFIRPRMPTANNAKYKTSLPAEIRRM